MALYKQSDTATPRTDSTSSYNKGDIMVVIIVGTIILTAFLLASISRHDRGVKNNTLMIEISLTLFICVTILRTIRG